MSTSTTASEGEKSLQDELIKLQRMRRILDPVCIVTIIGVFLVPIALFVVSMVNSEVLPDQVIEEQKTEVGPQLPSVYKIFVHVWDQDKFHDRIKDDLANLNGEMNYCHNNICTGIDEELAGGTSGVHYLLTGPTRYIDSIAALADRRDLSYADWYSTNQWTDYVDHSSETSIRIRTKMLLFGPTGRIIAGTLYGLEILLFLSCVIANFIVYAKLDNTQSLIRRKQQMGHM